jgi:hypothetical protein
MLSYAFTLLLLAIFAVTFSPAQARVAVVKVVVS